MNKKIKAALLFFFMGTALFAQTDKENEGIILDKSLLSVSRDNACDCITKIPLLKKSKQVISAEIKSCIEEQVGAYQLGVKLFGSKKNSGDTSINISISADKNSNEFIRFYYEIERSLRDSCAGLKNAIVSNNAEQKNSMSKNQEAREYYFAGQDAVMKEDFAEGAKYFKKAVDKDPNFAFAWDNLGVCLRRTGQYTEAIKAYETSLSLDPTGTTPLQNLPVVFNLLKNYDKALQYYQKFITAFPRDPEGYFGAGHTYFYNKNNTEKALDLMCKAYNLYVEQGSPYRVDAEKIINEMFTDLKKKGKENLFTNILKENNISPSK